MIGISLRQIAFGLAVLMAVPAAQLMADMTVEIQVRQTAATTQPAATQPVAPSEINIAGATTRPTQPASVESSASVVAVDGHPFAGSFKMDGRTVEISGDIKPLSGTEYQVHYHFLAQSDRSLLELDSDVSVKAGDDFLLGRETASGREVILTLKPGKP
jgi:hypothetical protein